MQEKAQRPQQHLSCFYKYQYLATFHADVLKSPPLGTVRRLVQHSSQVAMALDLGTLKFYDPLVGGVLLHGLVDCINLKKLMFYILATIPIHGVLLNSAFFISSFIHIATDTNKTASVLLHATIAASTFCDAREIGTSIMLLYMWSVHMPLMLYHSTINKDNLSFVVIITSILIGSYKGSFLLKKLKMINDVDYNRVNRSARIIIPPTAQKIVICHVLANLN